MQKQSLGLKCASFFELQIDMAEGSDIWTRLRTNRNNRGLDTRVVLSLCSNIWRERNTTEYLKKLHNTIDACVFRVYTDIMFWTDLLSDR